MIYTGESGGHFHSIVKDRLEKANGRKSHLMGGKTSCGLCQHSGLGDWVSCDQGRPRKWCESLGNTINSVWLTWTVAVGHQLELFRCLVRACI